MVQLAENPKIAIAADIYRVIVVPAGSVSEESDMPFAETCAPLTEIIARHSDAILFGIENRGQGDTLVVPGVALQEHSIMDYDFFGPGYPKERKAKPIRNLPSILVKTLKNGKVVINDLGSYITSSSGPDTSSAWMDYGIEQVVANLKVAQLKGLSPLKLLQELYGVDSERISPGHNTMVSHYFLNMFNAGFFNLTAPNDVEIHVADQGIQTLVRPSKSALQRLAKQKDGSFSYTREKNYVDATKKVGESESANLLEELQTKVGINMSDYIGNLLEGNYAPMLLGVKPDASEQIKRFVEMVNYNSFREDSNSRTNRIVGIKYDAKRGEVEVTIDFDFKAIIGEDVCREYRDSRVIIRNKVDAFAPSQNPLELVVVGLLDSTISYGEGTGRPPNLYGNKGLSWSLMRDGLVRPLNQP